MAEQAAPPPPVDRPLQKSYLREFSGWSTYAAPGISEPTSLRKMENIFIKRDGGAAVRPGLRSVFTKDFFFTTPLVGSFENFFTNDGKKAILFAVRELGSVVFKAGVYNTSQGRYELRTLGALGFDLSPDINFTGATTYVRYVQIDNKILALSDQGEPLRVFYVGESKKGRVVRELPRPAWNPEDDLQVIRPTNTWINYTQKVNIPTAGANNKDTLTSSVAGDNDYNFGYFYTFHNEIGESMTSRIRLVKTQRGYSFWKMESPKATGEPSGTVVASEEMAADQLVAIVPEATFNSAIANGATGWSLFMFTWSDQAPVPVEAVKIGERLFDDTSVWQDSGWIAHTPMVAGFDEAVIIPSLGSSKDNFSAPPKAAQGLVAGDRVVLVYDRGNSARIYWSSALQGEYLSFSPSKGGGFKTLTSGNLYLPVSVKLWQNPQSVDTICILCMGVDGYSTSYYMSPNTSVSGNVSAVQIMGFEETTATPGTVSPFGVEVLNNALYHPLDSEIMKSTAANYSINHSSITEDIQNKWMYLRNKDKIVSSQHDNRLYYIVDNPEGSEVPEGYMGNEVWVCDTANTATWSRWLVPGIALRKIEIAGAVYMAVVQADGIYVFDELQPFDEVRGGAGITKQQPIPWLLETNTQGASKTHDAWGRLQQVGLVLSSFSGTMEYGISSWDIHGRPVSVYKQMRDLEPVDYAQNPLPFDTEDYLLVRKDLKEWYFYARSVTDLLGSTLQSYGQISNVTYRFAPTTVNVGYEYGSTETFEYQRSQLNWGSRTTDNGVPQPVLDTRHQ